MDSEENVPHTISQQENDFIDNNNNNEAIAEAASRVIVRVRGIPLCPFALFDTQSEMPILFEIDTESETGFAPFELCIVLDGSGSMAGTKLNNARNAISSIMEQLRPQDKLHLVVYDDNAKVVFRDATLENKAVHLQEMQRIVAGGWTNISTALEAAERVLSESSITTGKRIFLFSDGQVNRGLGQNGNHSELFDIIAALQEKWFVTSSFGIGEDFDEALMTGIARYGKGSYYFLKPERIQQVVELALSQLLSLIGSEATFNVVAQEGIARLTQIHGHDALLLEGGGVAPIGDIKESNHKEVLTVFEIRPTSRSTVDATEDPSSCSQKTILTYSLEYKDLQGDLQRVGGIVKLQFTDDVSQTEHREPNVEVAHVVQKMVAVDVQFRELLANGEREEALQVKRNSIIEMERFAERDTRGFLQASLRRARRLVSQMEEETVNDAGALLQVGYDMERAESMGFDRVNSEYEGGDDRTRDFQHFGGVGGSLDMDTFFQRRQSRTMSPPDSPVDYSPPDSPTAFENLHSHHFDSNYQLQDQDPSAITRTSTPTSVHSNSDIQRTPPHRLMDPNFPSQCIPNEFFCPITKEVMTDPVVAEDGHSYERAAIEEWLSSHDTSPKTGLSMSRTLIIPNHQMRSQIMTLNDNSEAIADKNQHVVATTSDNTSESSDQSANQSKKCVLM